MSEKETNVNETTGGIDELLSKYAEAEVPKYYSEKNRSKKNDPIKTVINQLIDKNVNDNVIIHVLVNEYGLDIVKAKQRLAANKAIRTTNQKYGPIKNLLNRKKEQ